MVELSGAVSLGQMVPWLITSNQTWGVVLCVYTECICFLCYEDTPVCFVNSCGSSLQHNGIYKQIAQMSKAEGQRGVSLGWIAAGALMGLFVGVSCLEKPRTWCKCSAFGLGFPKLPRKRFAQGTRPFEVTGASVVK